LKGTVVPEPFKNFIPSSFRALIPVIESGDNLVILLPAVIPAQPDRLVKKMFDNLV
jgi:hypothetical protein